MSLTDPLDQRPKAGNTFLFWLIHMKIIYWNVQGAKKSELQHELGFINRTIKPNILLLLEPMFNQQNTDLIANKLGYQR